MKNVHNTLQHLVWMMEEVASGDYKQRLHMQGDISLAFNHMVDNLIELSLYDHLTGLLNMEGFQEHAAALLAATVPSTHYYVIAININDFKNYNALYSSEQGDALLRKVGHFLQSCCLTGELCARLHADNFVCLVQGKNAKEIIKRLNVDDSDQWQGITSRTYLFRHGIYAVEDIAVPVRRMQDCALYAANSIKNEPQKNFALFDATLAQHFNLENSLLKNFHQAITEKNFHIYYQPKVDLATGKIISCEALTRWQSPQGQMVATEQFINVFETNGLITALDFYAAEEVCALLKQQLEAKAPMVQIAVNFSRVHLLNKNFVQQLLTVLGKYHIDPHWLQIELTESAFMENRLATLQMVRELHEAGLTIAMDDFGTGYSSLNFLKNIPIDVIKIDKLFFAEFATEKRVRLLLKDILSIAKHLQLKTVAEGVETKEEVDFLQRLGCNMVQGYYFYKPLTKEQLLEVLAEQ